MEPNKPNVLAVAVIMGMIVAIGIGCGLAGAAAVVLFR